MNLRPAEPRDTSEIAAIQAENWRLSFAEILPPELVNAWTGYLTTVAFNNLGRADVTVAEEGADLVGFVAVENARLWSLFVRPKYWGQGAAQLLYEAADRACGEGLYLHVLRDNVRARRFFERRGLKVLAEAKDLYFDFEVPSVIYGR
ncbi:MAG TPA: GNAT family N-acetyltransferase [Candidatus Cybelea sp.]|nr:GNAT family N-acetyltransferase [Candidatus Cybelea sp.]